MLLYLSSKLVLCSLGDLHWSRASLGTDGHACIAPSSDPAVTGGIFSHWLTSDPIFWLKIWKKKKPCFWCFSNLILYLQSWTAFKTFKVYYWDLKAGNNASQLGWWILHILWWMDKKPGDFFVTPASTSPCNTGFCFAKCLHFLSPIVAGPMIFRLWIHSIRKHSFHSGNNIGLWIPARTEPRGF